VIEIIDIPRDSVTCRNTSVLRTDIHKMQSIK